MSFPLHFRKHFRHRVPVHPQEPSELPHGGQLGSWAHLTRLNQIYQLRLELGVYRELIFAI
jgi:hypothetical protein